MEPNNELGGSAMFSGISSCFQQQQQEQNPQHMQQHQPHVVPFGSSSHHDTETQQQFQQQIKNKQQQQQQGSVSDEGDPNFNAAEESIGDPNNKRKNSPWQRMKWTDTMVRLLIMAVYYIGDEDASEGNDPNGKKVKSSTGFLQKKGKWKSVSRAMMEKGFYVSPQQCEDKFNDLNKRYKRVNDILGKGTSCRVVENQKLLDTMDHLSPKMKEEVRKLLNSKHLFFREMCAYHNSCGHGANNNSGGDVPRQVEVVGEVSHQSQLQQEHQEQQCFHSSDDNGVANLRNLKMGCDEEDQSDDDEDDNNDDESEDYSDEDDDEIGEFGAWRGQGGNGREETMKDNENNDHHEIRPTPSSRKAASSSSQMMQQLCNEVRLVLQDGGKSIWEKKEWVRSRIVQLEEQQVSYNGQAFEIEKQRLKWERFSSKNEREIERAMLENEKRRLENERMVLLIRQKELELMNLQQQNSTT